MTIAEPRFAPTRQVPPLEAGDHLDQPTFLERYEAMPPGTRAELVGGIVYMSPPPVGDGHSAPHGNVVFWLHCYKRFTPGGLPSNDGTAILGDDSQPQPDAALRVGVGGQTRLGAAGYIIGCPEFVCEVANSTEAYDLHAKRRDYELYGAQEYLAVVVRTPRVVWFAREGNRQIEVKEDADGILRSRAFPGLWLDPTALLSGDLDRLVSVLEQGLATPEHAAFVARLARLPPGHEAGR